MSIRIKVEAIEVSTKSGTSARTGKAYSIREQEAWAHLVGRDGKPHPYPTRIRMTLGDEQAPYPVGVYQVAPESFYADRFGALSLGLVLAPVAAESSKKAA